jgi:hypothetical protein
MYVSIREYVDVRINFYFIFKKKPIYDFEEYVHMI